MPFVTCSPGRIAGISIGLLVFGLFSQRASGQADPAALVRGLNNQLLQLHSDVLQSLPSQAEAQRSQATQVIGQRAAALSDLIQQDPAQALSLPGSFPRILSRHPGGSVGGVPRLGLPARIPGNLAGTD
jgi:hypothetical protein